MLSHNVTSKFIHSLRTSLPDDASVAHFQQLDRHIQDAFLHRAIPGWRHSHTHSAENMRCSNRRQISTWRASASAAWQTHTMHITMSPSFSACGTLTTQRDRLDVWMLGHDEAD